jgi:raffinose/stachyose/melibiose transport system permease protein
MLEAKKSTLILNTVLILTILVVFMFPFWFVVSNAFKTMGEIIKDPVGFPPKATLKAFTTAWVKMKFPLVFLNTFIITAGADIILLLFAPMTGYFLLRRRSRFGDLLYSVLIASMAIPFQTIMIPLVKLAGNLHLSRSFIGLIIGYLGLGSAGNMFLSYGAVKSIPLEIEEAAVIDGCSQIRLYFKIIFPLLRTIILTFTIMNTFWFWNDYLMPQLMIGAIPAKRNIQMALRMFQGEYLVRWDIVLAALLLALLPPIIFFIFSQKKIVSGILSGAVKG